MLRIATNLLDVPAETIAVLYEYRWTIEIFFRFFKHVLGCRHLLSLCTGRKPTLRTYEMICFYFCGLASEDELLVHIGKLQMQPPDS